jgi:hypothetical protein
LNPCSHISYVTSSLRRGWGCLLGLGFTLLKCMYCTHSILLEILLCALYANPLSVQVLQSRSCLSYLSYVTMAAYIVYKFYNSYRKMAWNRRNCMTCIYWICDAFEIMLLIIGSSGKGNIIRLSVSCKST